MKYFIIIGMLFLPLMVGAAPQTVPQIFLAGDSTMSDKPLDLPEVGWGMSLRKYFIDPSMIHNHAMNGRSTNSFISEGRWQKLIDELKAGDYVIIQFGHNDEKLVDMSSANSTAMFRTNLRRFVRDVRVRHAEPILATPVARRNFNAAGKLQPTHGEFPDAVRAVAAEEKVHLLDLERATSEWLQFAGDEPSKKFFMWIEPGKFEKLPEGRKDDTHFVEAGADHVAELAIAQMRELRLPISRWLK